MTYLIHVYYCLVVPVTVPDNLSTFMLLVYFVTLPGTCYTFCYGTLLCMLVHSWPYSKIIHVSHGHRQVIIYIHTNNMLGNDDFIGLINNTVITY